MVSLNERFDLRRKCEEYAETEGDWQNECCGAGSEGYEAGGTKDETECVKNRETSRKETVAMELVMMRSMELLVSAIRMKVEKTSGMWGYQAKKKERMNVNEVKPKNNKLSKVIKWVCWHKGYGAGVDDYITLGKAQNWNSSLEDKTAELQEMPRKMEESQHMDAKANWKLSSQDAG